MSENKTEGALLEGLDANLIPAVVPVHISEQIPHVVSEQPRNYSSKPDNGAERSINQYSRRSQQTVKNPEGLARLGVADEVVISIDQPCVHCANSGTNYFIRDISKGDSEESQIFKGAEGPLFCPALCIGSVGSLRNVVIRDRENLPVARVCFKEKHFLLDSLVLAVYCPPQTLLGTIEQSPSCFVFSKEFILGNQNGEHEFRISYEGGFCTSQFVVTSLQNQDDNPKVAYIVEKSGNSIRIKFVSKMSINSKLILLGFCIGAIHKRMPQNFIGPLS